MMPRRRRNILAPASWREVVGEYAQLFGIDFCVAAPVHSEGFLVEQGYRQGRPVRMLTLLQLLVIAASMVTAFPYHRYFRFSSSVKYATIGILFGSSLIWYSSDSPSPSVTFNSSDLTRISHPIARLIQESDAWVWEESYDEYVYTQHSGELPPELYPQAVSAPPPMIVTLSTMAQESWAFDFAQPERRPVSPPVAESVTIVDSNASIAATQPEPRPQPLQEGAEYTIRAGDNLWLLAQAYSIDYQKLMQYNPTVSPRRMQPGDKIYLPGVNDPLKRSDRMVMPLAQARIHSGYGLRKHPIGGGTRFHRGIDFAASEGTPIKSVLDGTVIDAGMEGALGRIVRIQHANGLRTVYAHCSRLAVRKGDRVQQGQIIAYSGSTGRTTGPHLHFEVWQNGRHVDPINFLPR